MRRVVVVGAGLAGHRAALAMRRQGFDGELWIVGNERHFPYDRPPLSKQLLAGSVQESDCHYDCDGLQAKWLLGQEATGLDPIRQIVRVGRHRELHYDALVIATGRRARTWPGLPELQGFHVLRGLDDAAALRSAVASRRPVAIVGAGFIGCEVAATLRGLGVDAVTMIDTASHPMSALGPEAGSRAGRIHAEHGVRLRMGTSVAAFEGNDRVEAVRLENGELIEAETVLFALGSVPNSEWVAGTGLELLGGCIVCDETCMAVGANNVAVAGDVAAYPHPWVPRPISIEHWANARDMGTIAGANLVADPGSRAPFVVVPTFWSAQYEVKIKSAGFIGLADTFRGCLRRSRAVGVSRRGAPRGRHYRRRGLQPEPNDHRLPADPHAFVAGDSFAQWSGPRRRGGRFAKPWKP